MDKAYDRKPTERSRQLRNNPTLAEKKLWTVLRNRQLGGARFNRQVPIGPYIGDFAARTEMLVIELDGGQHGSQEAYDSARTSYLRAKGYCVIRFWNNEVLENLEGVTSKIERILKNRPSPNPSRDAGGEEAPRADGEGP